MPNLPIFAPAGAQTFHLLELNVISAQDLYAVGGSMHTYAVAWVSPETKLSTRVDKEGHSSPTWNDKFVFRISDDFLHCDTSAVMVEIYCVKFFRDAHVGTVRVLLSNLLPTISSHAPPRHIVPTRFVALQVRRPSGRPQGILNVGVALLDATMQTIPIYSKLNTSAVGYRAFMGEPRGSDHLPQHYGGFANSPRQYHYTTAPVPHLRRAKSDILSDLGKDRPPFSTIETSELHDKPSALSDSEIGPSPSIVAAKVAAEKLLAQVKLAAADQEPELASSGVVDDWSVPGAAGLVGPGKEGLNQKLERWRAELPPLYNQGGYESFRSEVSTSGHGHRKTDGGGGGGGGGLFSCFGDSFGCECSIICGRPRKARSRSGSKMPIVASDPNLRRKYG